MKLYDIKLAGGHHYHKSLLRHFVQYIPNKIRIWINRNQDTFFFFKKSDILQVLWLMNISRNNPEELLTLRAPEALQLGR